MSYFLLDTHVLLWFIEDDSKLSDRVKDILTNENTQLAISIINLWEIVIKLNIRKLSIDYTIQDIYQLLSQLNIEVLSIEYADLNCYLTLPLYHRDPFDRLLIAQAINRGFTLISTDEAFEPYPVNRLW